MKLFSFLGSEPFFLLLLPLVYWNIDRRIGARLGILLICSVVLNDIIKVAFALPRPLWAPGIQPLSSEVSFGFPSGHAQSTAALWTFVALQTRRPRLWVALAFVLLILVALSRLYLGAHYPLDVVGGALIGYGLLAIFLRAEKPIARALGHSLPLQIAAIITAGLVAGVLYWLASRRLIAPEQSSAGFEAYVSAIAGDKFVQRLGALLGLCGGLALAAHFVPFATAATSAQKIIRFVVGIAVTGSFIWGGEKIAREFAAIVLRLFRVDDLGHVAGARPVRAPEYDDVGNAQRRCLSGAAKTMLKWNAPVHTLLVP